MKRLIGTLLLAGSSAFAGPRIFFGVGVGVPVAPPPAYAPVYAPAYGPGYAYVPPCPGPGYTWIGGYWYPAGARYVWRPGYWARPPYRGAVWMAPRYHRGFYYRGYWR